MIVKFTIGFANVNPGQQWTQWFSWGSDPGPLYIIPNPLNPGGFLRIDNEYKKLNNDGSVQYFITFTNIGTVATNVNFQGGGLV